MLFGKRSRHFERSIWPKFAWSLQTQRGGSNLKEFALEHIYNAPPALEIEIAGFQVIGALLDLYSAAMEDNSTPREKMIRHLFPPQFLEEAFKPNDSPYLRLLSVVDFVSGMTDSYAVSLYRKLTGVGILSA